MATYRPCKEPFEVTRAQADQALEDGYGVSHTVEVVMVVPDGQPKDTAKRTAAPREETREVLTLHDPETGKPVKPTLKG
jgi:hypothetical protein